MPVIATAMRRLPWILLTLATAALLTLAPPVTSSAQVEEIMTAPSAPQNLMAVPDDRQVWLTWEAPADDGSAEILFYEYSYHEVGNEEDAETGTSANLGVTIAALTNGTAYTFMVRAENSVGAGAWATVTATPAALPGEPRNLMAAPGDEQVTLTWEAPASDGGAPIIRYDYAYGEPGSGNQTTIVGGTDLTLTIDGLTNGTEYNLLVWAVNSTGAGPWVILRATPAALPGAPRNLGVTSGDSYLLVDWDAPASDGGAAITDYQYRYVAGETVPENSAWTDVPSKPLALNNLSNGTEYAIELRAVNSAGEGPTASIAGTPGRVPSEPQNLVALPGNGAATLSWEAPADDGGAAMIRYDYRYAEGATVPADTGWTSAGLTLTVTVGNLTNGVLHAFQLRAVNGAGNGHTWALATATPDVDPVVTVHPQQAAYRFAEGASDAGVAIVAHTGAEARRPSEAFSVSVVTVAVPGGATSPDDYKTLSEMITIQPSDFVAAGDAWTATKTVALTIHDDGVSEDEEAFEVRCCFARNLTTDFSDCLTRPVPGFPTLFGLFRSDGRALTVPDCGASALPNWG